MPKPTPTEEKWDGEAMTQEELMNKDTVITLDENDIIVGSASKKKSHIFSLEKPRGILHRAFSVFLFDATTGELLLQKRAKTKNTFPNVWTSTCCSHPLHGMSPSEVDTPADVDNFTVPGVKNAAIRKLHHELGIPPGQIPADRFRFLTRFHYWATDTVTLGSQSPRGEHVINYVLFARVKREELTIEPHPEEVDDIMWVSRKEMLKVMEEGLWSPWIRIIAEVWLDEWWKNLDGVMESEDSSDLKIWRFDPPVEHLGGAGNAGIWLGGAVQNYEKKSNQDSQYNPVNSKLSILSVNLLLIAMLTGLKFLYPQYFASILVLSLVPALSFNQCLSLCFFAVIISTVCIVHLKSELVKLQMGIPMIPSPIPLLGSALAFATSSPWDLMEKWHTLLGPAYSFTLLGQRCIAVSSPSYLKIILQSKIQNVKKDISFSYKPFLPILGKGIVTSEGKEWMRQRLAASRLLKFKVLERIPQITYSAIKRLFHKLDACAERGESIELAEELRHLTLQVIAETFFSLEAEECNETFAKMYLPIVEEGNKRVWNPTRAWAFVLPAFWEYRKKAKMLNKYVEGLIQKRWKDMDGNYDKTRDVLDHLIVAYVSKKGWDDSAVIQLRDEMKTFLLAGHETSAAMMTWAVYEILRNKSLMIDLRKEGLDVFGKYNGDFAKNMPTREDLSKLNFSECCLKEALRKYSVVPTVTRNLSSQTELGPHSIPSGTKIMVSIQAVHHNPEYWTEPMKYDPTRFFETPKPFTFIPFLEGPRNCLGQYLSLLESKIVLSMLMHEYDFELAEDVKMMGEPRHRYMVPVIPKAGIEVFVKKRC